MKGIGIQPIYSVSNLKGRTRNQQEKIKQFDGHLNNNEGTIKETQGLTTEQKS
jgi:hypothetical protein